jgi:hypothetical protein
VQELRAGFWGLRWRPAVLVVARDAVDKVAAADEMAAWPEVREDADNDYVFRR